MHVPTEDHLERQKHISLDKNKADAHTCGIIFSLHVKHGRVYGGMNRDSTFVV